MGGSQSFGGVLACSLGAVLTWLMLISLPLEWLFWIVYKQTQTVHMSYPRGLVQWFSVGPNGSWKVNKSRATFLQGNFAGSDFPFMLSFRFVPLPNMVWQTPGTSLWQDKKESSEKKCLWWDQGTRVPRDLCHLPWLQSWRPERPMTNENQIASKIHLNLLGLSIAI
jgi:hypothetical protein